MAQVITVAFSPLITRFYGPEAFGLLGVFASLLTMLAPIAALSYPFAVVLPKEDADAKGIIRLSLTIAPLTSMFVALLLLFDGKKILALLGSESIAPYVMLIPLSMFFIACEQVTQQWALRKKYFSLTARNSILKALFLNCAIVGTGFLFSSGFVLIVLSAAGHILHALLFWSGFNSIQKRTVPLIKPITSPRPLRELLRAYYDFPLYRTPQTFLNALSQSLPILMLAFFFGPASTGFYSIGRKVLGLPSALVGAAVGNVFFPRIAEAAQNGENITRLILKATIALAAVGLIPFSLIFAFGPWVFSIVFGSDWITAGEYARWLSVWLFFGFINVPSVKTLPVISAQKFLMIFELYTLFTRAFSLLVGVYLFESDLIAIIIFSCSGAIINFALVLITLHKSKGQQKRRI